MIVMRCDERMRRTGLTRRMKTPGFRTHGAAVVFAMLMIGFLGGCGKTKPSRYYQLTSTAAGAPTIQTPTFPVGIIVYPLMAPEVYRASPIVYSVGPEQMGVYARELWIDPPPKMIQQVLVRDLRSSGHYQSVYFQESGALADFALRGRLYDFREVDSGSNVAARVTMDIELRNTRTGATVWTHYYTHDEPATDKTVPAVVSALDKNVQLGVSEVAAGLDQYFTTHPPSK